jgi:ankyrin repeat protein
MIATVALAITTIAGCDANRNRQEPTPASAAISGNTVQMTKFLDEGYDVNTQNEYGQTLLHIASAEGNTETVVYF